MHNPFDVVRMFEENLAEYTGAPYAVATTSCTTALLMCLSLPWEHKGDIGLPRKTYVGVAQSIINSGRKIKFWKKNEDWCGMYRLAPLPIWDCARHLTSDMYMAGQLMCLSFHWTKHLGIGQGGAILCDHPITAECLRRMRFDGRTEGVAPDEDQFIGGYHAYMMPRDAAEGMTRLSLLPEHNDPLPNSNYPDLSKQEWFK